MRAPRWIAFALATLAQSAEALAQSAPTDTTAPAQTTASATLSDAQRAEARAALARGNELFTRENYESALTEFLRVYEIARERPTAFIYLLNIARCYERMFRYDRAIEFYQRYLERAPSDDQDRASTEATIRTLEGLLGTIELRSNVADAQVWIDEHLAAERVGTVRVPGGVHVVELRARGYSPSRQQVQLPARTTQTLSFQLERLQVRRGLSPAFFATVAGVGVATGVGAIVCSAQALSTRAEVDRLIASGERAQVGVDQQERIRTFALATDVLIGVTAAAAIGATLLGVATEWRRPAEPSDTRRARRVIVAPMVSSDARGVSLGGSL